MVEATEQRAGGDVYWWSAKSFGSSFALADFFQTYLLEGLDDIALTLRHERDIAAFEAKRAEWLPRVH